MYKMPDKLFIVEERGALIVNYDKNDASNTEYIRKDAVLDLLNEEKEKTSIGLCEYDMGHENGRMEVINSFIDKLNSL